MPSPRLVINPTDVTFERAVRDAVAGVADAGELQRRLRAQFARAVVRRRDLSGEPEETWYVYRDGRWVATSRDLTDSDPRSRTEEAMAAKQSDGAPEISAHLRGASDAIMLLLREVAQLEQHKRGVPPGEERFEELASAVQVTAEALAEFTAQEAAWAREAPLEAHALATIEETHEPDKLARILERWREVERRLDAADPGTEEAARLFAEFEQLRREYLAAFDARQIGSPTDR